MRLNREKVSCGLAALVLLLSGIWPLVSYLVSPVANEGKPSFSLNESSAELPPIAPRLHAFKQGKGRNPFKVSSDWREVVADPLAPPPAPPPRPPRIPFGALRTRLAGAPQTFLPRQPVDRAEKAAASGAANAPAPPPPAPPAPAATPSGSPPSSGGGSR